MQETGNTVVITGGSSGIGLAAAEVLAAAGNDVIVCGRSEERLRTVKERLPQLHTLVCDVSDRAQRAEFFSRVAREFPGVNVLINNAGIQRERVGRNGTPKRADRCARPTKEWGARPVVAVPGVLAGTLHSTGAPRRRASECREERLAATKGSPQGGSRSRWTISDDPR